MNSYMLNAAVQLCSRWKCSDPVPVSHDMRVRYVSVTYESGAPIFVQFGTFERPVQTQHGVFEVVPSSDAAAVAPVRVVDFSVQECEETRRAISKLRAWFAVKVGSGAPGAAISLYGSNEENELYLKIADSAPPVIENYVSHLASNNYKVRPGSIEDLAPRTKYVAVTRLNGAWLIGDKVVITFNLERALVIADTVRPVPVYYGFSVTVADTKRRRVDDDPVPPSPPSTAVNQTEVAPPQHRAPTPPPSPPKKADRFTSARRLLMN